MASRKWISRGVLLLAALTASGCDGFFHDAAPAAPAELALTTALSTTGPLPNPALAPVFDQTNRVRVRVIVEETGVVLADEVQSASPDTEGIRLQLRIDLPETRLRVRVEVELFRDSQLLFQGSFVTELVRGQAAGGEVPLTPRPAQLRISGPDRIEVLQQSVQLTAELLMATGDPIPDASFTWTPLDPSVVSVNSAGLATAVSEGQGRIVAVSQGLADTVTIAVQATVASVEVSPSLATVPPGGQATFQAVVRDQGGNPLVRTVTWSTSNPAVASITSAGVATAGLAGETQVRAAVGTVVGTAVLRVLPPVPSVTTGGTSGVTGSGANLMATINPSGSQTQAWFEFSTSETLATFESTTRLGIGSGTQPVSFQQFVGNLQPQTTVYYRAAAENAGGLGRGEILSFTTPVLQVPFAPSGLTMQAQTTSFGNFIGFLVSWNDNSNNEDRFELQRRQSENNFTLLQTLPASVAEAFDGDVEASYCEGMFCFYEAEYRVRACNAAGCSPYSSSVWGYYDDFFGGYFRENTPASGRSGGR